MVWLVSSVALAADPPVSDACGLTRVQLVIQHESREAAQAREAKLAGLQYREPREVPPGGWVYAAVLAANIDDAQTDRLTVVAQDATGAEVLRADGGWRLPKDVDTGIPGLPLWTDWLSAPVTGPITYPLELHVIDNVQMERCSWRVQEDGTSDLVEGKGPTQIAAEACAVHQAEASAHEITINGVSTWIEGADSRDAIEAKLRACKLDDAADDFVAWRNNRIMTTALSVSGLFTLGFAWVFVPIPAISAPHARDRMLEDLLHPPTE